MKKLTKLISLIMLASSIMANAVNAAQFGVCTHMGLGGSYANNTNVETAKGSGVAWVRDECRWEYMQSAQGGEFSIRVKDLDYIKKLDESGINQLLIFAYGNMAYANGAEMPRKANAAYYQGWLDYVRYTVEQVKDYVDAYEVWNEPNLSYFNYNLLGTPEDYAQLYLDTKTIVDELDPTAIVLCGSITGVETADINYGKGIFNYIKSKGDVNALIDGFSIHQYTNKVDTDYVNRLDTWESIFDSYGFTGEVWMTENGVSSNTGNNTETQQAAYIAKVGAHWENYLKSSGRDGVNIWYDLREDGTDAAEYEHNLGLVDYNYNPKEAYYAMQAYNDLTGDKSFAKIDSTKTKDNWFSDDEYGYVAKYTGETGTTYVVWDTNSNGKTANVELSGDVAYVYNYKGEVTETIANPSGTKTITMAATPVYVECIELSTVITSASYDEKNGVVNVSGVYNNGDSVTVEIIKDGAVVKSETAIVTDEKFEKWFSFSGNGDYVVRVGQPELSAIGKTEGWAEKTITVTGVVEKNPVFDVSTQVAYNAETRTVNIVGKITDYVDNQNVTILAVPYSMDVNNVDINAAAYVKQIPATNGEFADEFVVPDYFTTKMALYLGGTEIKAVSSNEAGVAESEYMYVTSFEVDKGDIITATAIVRNFTETDKNATIIIAQYDSENALQNISLEEKTIPAKTYKAVECSLTGISIDAKATRAKAYIWNNMADLVPLADFDEVLLK